MRVFRWWIRWLRFNLSNYRYMRFSKYLLYMTSFLIIVDLLYYGWTHTIWIHFIFIYVFNKLSNMNSTLNENFLKEQIMYSPSSIVIYFAFSHGKFWTSIYIHTYLYNYLKRAAYFLLILKIEWEQRWTRIL